MSFNLKIISLRKGYEGDQSALILQPEQKAMKLVIVSYIMVGLINCHVRRHEDWMTRASDACMP